MNSAGGVWLACIDMQRLFLEPGEWFCSSGIAILPNCRKLAEAAPNRCLFTRFVPARSAADAEGAWRGFYRRWESVTLEAGDAGAIELHPDLKPLSQDGRIFDKSTYDCFASAEFADFIDRAKPEALVLFGVETDVCVLATALSAVDRGIRTVLPVDAIASGRKKAHAAAVKEIYPRFDLQIELTDTASVLNSLVNS
ncbi:MAG: cysteine hydrolase [Albidovulum sp.]|nr:cysteine hydrolase [Albidovulum sp.]MDE0304901.1 cysteine hydrolase [Albidovulum sp.]MDE0530168.1 cysteine hydrolase [Albidovulum sp.]